MMREINDALNSCGQQRQLVAVVFDAATDCRAFSAGVAVEEHVEETIFQMLDSFHAIFRNLEQLAKPMIAVIDGPALGGGCDMVAACDIAIASERARFGQPEIKLGVFPPVAAVLLPRIIGDKQARELILTGELMEAAEAKRLGLVNYVVPANELEQKTSELLARFRNLSAAALGANQRKAIDLGRGRSLDSALKEVENLYLNELMKTHDASEGVSAFIENVSRSGMIVNMKNSGPRRCAAYSRLLSGATKLVVLALLIALGIGSLDVLAQKKKKKRRPNTHSETLTSHSSDSLSPEARETMVLASGVVCKERIKDPKGSVPIDDMQARPSLPVKVRRRLPAPNAPTVCYRPPKASSCLP